MNKALKELTNIGVPCYSDIKLPLYDMTLDCANDKQKTIGIERNMRKEAIDRVDRVIDNKSLSTKRVTDIDNLNFFAEKYTEIIGEILTLLSSLGMMRGRPVSPKSTIMSLSKMKTLLCVKPISIFKAKRALSIMFTNEPLTGIKY